MDLEGVRIRGPSGVILQGVSRLVEARVTPLCLSAATGVRAQS